jgi:hypothetical protein
VSKDVELIKNADFKMTNLGPGVSNFGVETFKVMRLNAMNRSVFEQRRKEVEEVLKKQRN